MQTTLEISLYPNHEAFIAPIKALIERLNQYPDVKVQTFPTATVLCGEHTLVMQILATESRIQREQFGMGPLMVKVLAGYEAI